MENKRHISQTRRMIKHGLIVIMVGLFCGFGLGFAINDSFSISPFPFSFEYTMDATPAAWRAAHVGAITNGLMALLIAAVMPYIDLSATAIRRIATGIIVVIWGNVIFYVGALWAPNRGMSFGDTVQGPGNFAGGLAYGAAFVAAFVLVFVIGYLIRALPGKDDL